MSTPTPAVNPVEPALSVSSSGSSVPQEERLTRYLWHLLFFVSIATLFEGYDAVITGMALPYLSKDFGVGPKELGLATSAISVGTIVAFVPVRLADRYGRRPLLLLSVSGYSLFTILTAFSSGLYDFVLYQFVARACMVTESRIGMVLAPALVGALSSTVGSVGTTVALLAPGVWLCVPLVWRFLPETRRKMLEEIG